MSYISHLLSAENYSQFIFSTTLFQMNLSERTGDIFTVMRETALGTIISRGGDMCRTRRWLGGGDKPPSWPREAGMRAAAEEALHGPCSLSGATHETCNGKGLEELVACFGRGMGQENQDVNLDSCHRR